MLCFAVLCCDVCKMSKMLLSSAKLHCSPVHSFMCLTILSAIARTLFTFGLIVTFFGDPNEFWTISITCPVQLTCNRNNKTQIERKKERNRHTDWLVI